jgi:putative DNA primase/helicase
MTPKEEFLEKHNEQVREQLERIAGPEAIPMSDGVASIVELAAYQNDGRKQRLITEDAAALVFTVRRSDQLRFDHDAGRWFVWTGKYWRLERTKLAFAWARDLARELAQAKAAKARVVCGKTSFAAGVERFAQADRAFAMTSELWDPDRYLLGTPDGTIDLQTGKIKPPCPDDFITRITAVTPAQTADCAVWLRFLREATAEDDDLISYLRSFCGYLLTGDTREHALLFIYGPGGNGKTVFLNTVSAILGDYARVAAMETFTSAPTDKHPTDLAMLRGARLVCATETEEGRAWAESRIKQLTGGDPISARFMRQDFFTYIPAFKLVFIGNHKPALRNVDDAARRRFNIVPFLNKPPTPDQHLEQKLRAEWPGILRWMIDGCLAWQRDGLVRPAIVAEATNEYFSEQDILRQWVEECCETGGRNLSETSATLFQSWSAYAIASGEKPGTKKWFSQSLIRLGFEPARLTIPPQARGFLRIKVKPEPIPRHWSEID